jgi:transcription elongation factor GreA-like protein
MNFVMKQKEIRFLSQTTNMHREMDRQFANIQLLKFRETRFALHYVDSILVVYEGSFVFHGGWSTMENMESMQH